VSRRRKRSDANIVSLVHQILGQDLKVGIICGRGHRGERRRELYSVYRCRRAYTPPCPKILARPYALAGTFASDPESWEPAWQLEATFAERYAIGTETKLAGDGM
jgi:hypothetical protein